MAAKKKEVVTEEVTEVKEPKKKTTKKKTSVKKVKIVNAPGVNIRAEAEINDNVLFIAYEGDMFELASEDKINGFYKIYCNSGIGIGFVKEEFAMIF